VRDLSLSYVERKVFIVNAKGRDSPLSIAKDSDQILMQSLSSCSSRTEFCPRALDVLESSPAAAGHTMLIDFVISRMVKPTSAFAAARDPLNYSATCSTLFRAFVLHA